MDKSITTQNSSSYSKQTQTQTSRNKYLRTAGQRKKFNALYGLTKKSENKVNSLLKKGFKNPYASQLKNVVNQIKNKKFEYDLNADQLYKQYAEQYQAMGQRAMEEAQAEATALTGGYANSNAATQGQKAYNSYIQEMQKIVPQLYSQARADFDNEMAGLYNEANLYSGLGDNAFNEWTAKVQNAMANRDYNYNKSNNYYNSTQYSDNRSTNTTSSKSSTTTKKKK